MPNLNPNQWLLSTSTRQTTYWLYVSVGSAQEKLLSALLGVCDTRLGTLHPVLGPLVNKDVEKVDSVQEM